ncbi:reverse transcriptase domain-containing protein, partial [Tanacetum coccineum]
GSGAGLILTNPEGMEFTYALRFRFNATNNEAEYEALIAGLKIAEQIGVKNLQANVDSRLVANQVNGTALMCVEELLDLFFVEELKEKSISAMEVLAVVEEEGDTWMTPIFKYLVDGTLPAEMKKSRAVRRKSWWFAIINGTLYKKSFLRPWLRIGYYWPTMDEDARTLIRACQDCEVNTAIGKQFQDNPFKDWCEKLCIRQHFASVKHPQTNGLVERANRSLDPDSLISQFEKKKRIEPSLLTLFQIR